MVTEEENVIKIGDLVKWFDYYADGDIVKDAGVGIVLRQIDKSSNDWPDQQVLYLVYRMHRGTQEWYRLDDIDLMAKGIPKRPVCKAISRSAR